MARHNGPAASVCPPRQHISAPQHALSCFRTSLRLDAWASHTALRRAAEPARCQNWIGRRSKLPRRQNPNVPVGGKTGLRHPCKSVFVNHTILSQPAMYMHCRPILRLPCAYTAFNPPQSGNATLGVLTQLFISFRFCLSTSFLLCLSQSSVSPGIVFAPPGRCADLIWVMSIKDERRSWTWPLSDPFDLPTSLGGTTVKKTSRMVPASNDFILCSLCVA